MFFIKNIYTCHVKSLWYLHIIHIYIPGIGFRTQETDNPLQGVEDMSHISGYRYNLLVRIYLGYTHVHVFSGVYEITVSSWMCIYICIHKVEGSTYHAGQAMGFIYEIGYSVRYASVGIVVFQSATYSIGSFPTNPAILRVPTALNTDVMH